MGNVGRCVYLYNLHLFWDVLLWGRLHGHIHMFMYKRQDTLSLMFSMF